MNPGTDKFNQYKAQRLIQAFPKMNNISNAEEFAGRFLQLNPALRITAEDALRHKFFADHLPAKIYDLPPGMFYFNLDYRFYSNYNCR